MLFSVSPLAREEMFPIKESPAFNHMKYIQNKHDVALERRLGFEQ